MLIRCGTQTEIVVVSYGGTSAEKVVIRLRGTGRHNALRYEGLVPRRYRPNSVHYQSGERASANCILGILSTITSARP
jgi:hypothetical protein